MNNPEKLGTPQNEERKNKEKHNTICVGQHSTQASTNNVNETWALLWTTGGKD